MTGYRRTGYVLKDSAAADIVTGIKAVAAGEHFTSPAMTTYLINRSRRATPSEAHKCIAENLGNEAWALQIIWLWNGLIKAVPIGIRRLDSLSLETK